MYECRSRCRLSSPEGRQQYTFSLHDANSAIRDLNQHVFTALLLPAPNQYNDEHCDDECDDLL